MTKPSQPAQSEYSYLTEKLIIQEKQTTKSGLLTGEWSHPLCSWPQVGRLIWDQNLWSRSVTIRLGSPLMTGKFRIEHSLLAVLSCQYFVLLNTL